jgi:FkbM family methyltransferase
VVSRFVRYLLFLLLLVGALCLAHRWTVPAALALVGRARGCDFAQAAQAGAVDRLKQEIKDRLVRESRIVKRDPAGFNLWETPKGSYWMSASSDFVLHWDLAEQESHIYGTGWRAAQRGDVVLDCGANIGVYTRVALEAGAKLVVAIEPSPDNLECLRRNLEPEIKTGRVIIYPKGVWDKDDELTFRVDPKNSAANTFVVERPDLVESGKLPLTTIDKLAGELKLERVDYIKMDIEGAEPRALQGAKETIQRFHPRLAISVYHTPTDRDTIPRIIASISPSYKKECGQCSMHEWNIFPMVYFFR